MTPLAPGGLSREALHRRVEQSNERVRRGSVASFSLQGLDEDRLVFVVEVGEGEDPLSRVAHDIAVGLAEGGADVAAVALLAPNGLVRWTDSGVEADLMRQAWNNGTLDSLFDYRPAPVAVDASLDGEEFDLLTWMQFEIGLLLGLPSSSIDVSTPLADQGIDSMQLVELQERLESWLGRAVPAETFFACPTLVALASELEAGEQPVKIAPTADAPRPAPRDETSKLERSVAIVGIGVRIGDVTGPDELWEVVLSGDLAGRLAPSVPASSVDAHARFDARFFGIAPREAARIDPQHRVLLEVAWQGIEDAGIDPRSLAGTRTGVFVGLSSSEYRVLAERAGAVADVHAITGMSSAIAANRMSYLLDLHGPSLAVDTACSASLVALHLACRSLRDDECDLAVVAGVNLLLTPDISDGLETAGAMSPTGACHSFDAAADGYVRGEGCGVVVLERTADALGSRRRRYATILGSAVNQDGRTNGLTAPNPLAQERVIRAALADAERQPGDVFAVEAHGTGTPLGDPIEVAALRSVFAAARRPVVMTSIKSLVGHLEAAAGIVGVIRTAMSAWHGVIPPQAAFSVLNDRINLAGVLDIPAEARQWSEGLAGVSSFGFGGTNAHAVITRAGTPSPRLDGPDLPVLALSAATEDALRARLQQVADLLDHHGAPSVRARLAPVAGHHRYRAVVHGREVVDLRTGLQDVLARAELAPHGRPEPITIVFGGQGVVRRGPSAPSPGGGGAFASTFDRLSEAVGAVRGRRLDEWLGDRSGAQLPTDIAQPLLTAVTLALFRTLEAAELKPFAVIGHSVGEIAAAAAVGVIEDTDAVRFAAARGAVMADHMPVGAMVTVFAPVEAVEQFIDSETLAVVVAVSNTPASTVVSGVPSEVERFMQLADEVGLRCFRLSVDRAFHSPDIERCEAQLRHIASRLDVAPSRGPLVSTLDGIVRPAGWRPAPEHWVEHARRPVLFDSAIRASVAQGAALFVELSPQPGLGRLRRSITGERWLAAADPVQDGAESIGLLLADLYVSGHTVRLDRVRDEAVPSVPLPTYPFGGAKHWISGELKPTVTDTHKRTAPDAPPNHVTGGAMTRIRSVEAASTSAVTTSEGCATVQALRIALSGFGVTAGDEIALADLEPAAALVAQDAAAALGARTIPFERQRKGAGIVLTHLVSNTDGSSASPIVVDSAGRLSRHLDVLTPRKVLPRLSLAFFGHHSRGTERTHYHHLLEATSLADQLGLEAVWTPERHFDSFGGAYPAPAVLSAAIAGVTSNLKIRAGSVVVPLSHPARIAEEWALVDNLSDGRAGVAFATGWRDRDRVLAHSKTPGDVERSIDQIRRLWRGEELELIGVAGKVERVHVQPAPVQSELPAWLTVMKNPESWNRAARLDLNVLTNLIGRSVASLASAIKTYRDDRVSAGVAGRGEVTVFLHAHLGSDATQAREVARGPLEHYLVNSAAIFSQSDQRPWLRDRVEGMSPEELRDDIAALASVSASRYLEGGSMIGSPESCRDLLEKFGDIGVTEVACLVDFGMNDNSVLSTIEQLGRLATPGSIRNSANAPTRLRRTVS